MSQDREDILKNPEDYRNRTVTLNLKLITCDEKSGLIILTPELDKENMNCIIELSADAEKQKTLIKTNLPCKIRTTFRIIKSKKNVKLFKKQTQIIGELKNFDLIK